MGNEQSQPQVGDDVSPIMLSERTVDAVAHYINNEASNIVVLTGAGISTSAGIPDFRSPGTGLYANLERLKLPYAEAVFDISYFRHNPEPFYALARELYPGKFLPTISHAFIALLAKKDKLRMLFTQNIDCLERAAGIPSNLLIEAHGSFATHSCIECKLAYPESLMKEAIEKGRVPHCSENPQHGDKEEKCDGLVKPDIVFFGEQLPEEFYKNLHIAEAADIMLVIGTSLTVHPFAGLPGYAKKGVPRVLFNMERVGDLGRHSDDVCILGPCDDGIRKLAAALGWTDELEQLWAEMGGQVSSLPKLSSPSTCPDDEIDKITKAVGRATICDEKAEDTTTRQASETDGAGLGHVYVGHAKEQKTQKETTDSPPSESASSEPNSQPMSNASTAGSDTSEVVDNKEVTQHSPSSAEKETDLTKSPPKSNI